MTTMRVTTEEEEEEAAVMAFAQILTAESAGACGGSTSAFATEMRLTCAHAITEGAADFQQTASAAAAAGKHSGRRH